MTRLICCFVLSAIALFADVTGKWSGTGKGNTGDGDHNIAVNLELKQDGSQVTGTVGASEADDRYSIINGPGDGDVLTFKVSPDDVTYVVTLTVKDDKMTGEATASTGETKLTNKLELKNY